MYSLFSTDLKNSSWQQGKPALDLLYSLKMNNIAVHSSFSLQITFYKNGESQVCLPYQLLL